MTVTASITPLFTSLQNIKFSDLRSSFKEVSSGSINASEFKRNTDTNNKNPIVPDATENSNVSTGNNLKISQFQNTIKYHDLIQTGTNTNLNLATLSAASAGTNWSSNLSKTIVKRVTISGICSSTSTSVASLLIDAKTYNLNLIISGQIYGEGGSGGSSGNGNSGGNAMSLISSGGNIYVKTLLDSKVYGGGGGGAQGLQGASSDYGTCYTYSDSNTGDSCNGCPDCPPGTTAQGCFNSGSCDCGKGCSTSGQANKCRTYSYYNSAKTSGGAGGTGGPGRGYSNINGSLLGSPGTKGTDTTCPGATASVTKTSATGDTGATGGEWGVKGNDAGTGTSDPKGGDPGRAIAGSNYVITPDSSLASLKGKY